MTHPTLTYFDPAKGRARDGSVGVDLDRLLVSRALIQGVSGSGKSTALRALLEQTHGSVQQFVVDRDGDLATLRDRYPYLLVGPDGDIPVSLKSAALLTRRVVELGASAIIDLSEMKLDDQREWVRRSFAQLVDLPRSLWRPLIVGLDEGHLYCPERSEGEAVSREAVINVASLGRKRGFCLVVATQRISKLHKDCAAELQNKIIGYTDDVDVKRAADQLGMLQSDRRRLHELEPGEFYVRGPAIQKAPVLVSIGETKTKAPPRGTVRAPAAAAPKAIQALAEQLADLPKEAEEEARTIADLQREVAEKNRRIRELEKAQPKVEMKVKEITVDRPVPYIPEAEVKAVEEAATALTAACAALKKAARMAPPKLSGQKSMSMGFSVGPVAPKLPPIVRVPMHAGTGVDRHPSVEGLGKAERLILQVLAQYPDGRSIVQVAVMTGYSHAGGGFRNAIGALRSKGFIEGTGENLRIRGEGLEAVGPIQPLPEGTELLAHWKGQLGKAERSILEALAEAGPLPIETVAAMAGYEPGGGGFRNAVGKLRTLELIRGRRGEPLSLAEELT